MSFNIGGSETEVRQNHQTKLFSPARITALIVGLVLVAAGLILMMPSFGIETADTVYSEDWSKMWPMIMDKGRYIMVLAGFILIAGSIFAGRKKH